jgi:hypothetical protein
MTTSYADLRSRVRLHTLLNECDEDYSGGHEGTNTTPARQFLGALSARVRESTSRELAAASGSALQSDVDAALIAEKAGDGGAALKTLAVERLRAAARGGSTLPPRAAVFFRSDCAHQPALPAVVNAAVEPALTAEEARRAAARSALVTAVARAQVVASKSILAEWAALQNAGTAIEGTGKKRGACTTTPTASTCSSRTTA